MNHPISISIAGTTDHTVQCVEALKNDSRFSIAWVLTPEPQPIGRKKIVTKNPMHIWAEKNNVPLILVKKKIDQEIKDQISNIPSSISYLLVVDFGYLIPNWLLSFPQKMPINIHPSALPKFRGSSPGQFTLLFGEKESAISVIKMNDKLDEGDLIYQYFFPIPNTMTLLEYYSFAFEKIAKQLPQLFADLFEGKVTPQPQPIESPTPIARRLTKEDGYIEWEIIQSLISNHHSPITKKPTSNLMMSAFDQIQDWPTILHNAIRALSPWPGVWTMVPTNKGEKRMKILEIETNGEKMELKKVQLEGLQPTSLEEIRNQITTP